MKLLVSDTYIQELLSEQLTLQITTEPSDCKNWRGWSHFPTHKPRTWKGLVTEEVSVKAGGGPTIIDYFRKYLSCLPPCFPVTWRTNPNSLTGSFPFTSASPPQLCQGRDLPVLLNVSLCSLCPRCFLSLLTYLGNSYSSFTTQLKYALLSEIPSTL